MIQKIRNSPISFAENLETKQTACSLRSSGCIENFDNLMKNKDQNEQTKLSTETSNCLNTKSSKKTTKGICKRYRKH